MLSIVISSLDHIEQGLILIWTSPIQLIECLFNSFSSCLCKWSNYWHIQRVLWCFSIDSHHSLIPQNDLTSNCHLYRTLFSSFAFQFLCLKNFLFFLFFEKDNIDSMRKIYNLKNSALKAKRVEKKFEIWILLRLRWKCKK